MPQELALQESNKKEEKRCSARKDRTIRDLKLEETSGACYTLAIIGTLGKNIDSSILCRLLD